MKRLTMIGVALVAVFAMGAIFSASAMATSAPFWSIGGTRLAAGKTHFISAKPVSEKFTLSTEALGTEISCTGFSLKEGSLLGSTELNPGTNDEVVVFTGCKLETGNGGPTECKLETETLTTNSLKSELVEKAAAPKILLTEFFPAKGSVFIVLKFVGKCGVFEASVEGSTAAEVTTDNSAEETVELGQAAKQATSWRLRFPNLTSLKVILVKEGVAKEEKTELTLDSDPSIQHGIALVSLAKKNGSEPEEVLWSPLP
jgi:hypothetical protein